MTRYARAKGSKASNEKLPEQATSWAEMKKQLQEKYKDVGEQTTNQSEGSKVDGQSGIAHDEIVKSEWAEFKDKPSKEKKVAKLENNEKLLISKPENNLDSVRGRKRQFKEDRKNHFKEVKEKKRRLLDPIIVHGKEVEVVRFMGFAVKKEDEERLQKMRSELIKKGVPKNTINETMVIQRRRAEKALARAKKAVCFNCRQKGHQYFDCPESTADKNVSLPQSGLCFKCGSTEHTHYQCKVVKGKKYSFAVCFICKEQGHISGQCPDNNYGIYPNGGACKVCGDVTHLKRDCPVFRATKVEREVEAETINYKDIEALDPYKKKEVVCNKPPAVKKVKY